MEENRKSLKIKEDQFGEIRVVDDVVTIIAGLAATEVEGVSSMAGNITNEIVAKTGAKNLSRGVRVDVLDGIVTADLNLNIKYGYAIPEVSANVQERVRTAVENMTGLEVGTVNVRIASLDMAENK
ncbi:Asp23/Gls24 family envelope stress response protein [Lachnospiraceae bacterium 47-T17]